jgi:hypothetical protein
MNRFFKMGMVLILALAVSGSAFAAHQPKSKVGKIRKAHHNPHRPGPASNAQPGGHNHSGSNFVKPKGN